MTNGFLVQYIRIFGFIFLSFPCKHCKLIYTSDQIIKPSSDSKCLLKCWQLPPVEQFCMSPAALLRIFQPNMHLLLQAI